MVRDIDIPHYNWIGHLPVDDGGALPAAGFAARVSGALFRV
jgi:hypothetical protein